MYLAFTFHAVVYLRHASLTDASNGAVLHANLLHWVCKVNDSRTTAHMEQDLTSPLAHRMKAMQNTPGCHGLPSSLAHLTMLVRRAARRRRIHGANSATLATTQGDAPTGIKPAEPLGASHQTSIVGEAAAGEVTVNCMTLWASYS